MNVQGGIAEMMDCKECGRTLPEDRFNMSHGPVCFGCRVRTVRLGFSHGRDNFHESTFGERTRQAYADAAATGTKIIPKTTVGANSLPTGQLTKLANHLNGKAG